MNYSILYQHPDGFLTSWAGSQDDLTRFLEERGLSLESFKPIGQLNTTTLHVPGEMLSDEITSDHVVPVVFALDPDGLNPVMWYVDHKLYYALRDNYSLQYALDVSGQLEEGEEYTFFGTARYNIHQDGTGSRYYLGSESYQDIFHQSEYDPNRWFYNEDDRDQYDEDNKPEPQYTRDYHSGTLQVLRFDNETRYWIGLEIEKEDRDILESLEIAEFLDRCPTWRKERDGSLDDDGFELISPMMQLNVPEILRHINNSGTLVRHVNADYTDNCGGHINLSDESRSAWELFDDIAGYLPLLCALYPSRVHQNYCQAKPKHRLVQENDKYQAIKVHRDRIEIRIFPAVKNLRTLEFRLRLCEFMMKNPAPNPKLVKLNRIKPILGMIYPAPGSDSKLNETKFNELKQRIETFTQDLK